MSSNEQIRNGVLQGGWDLDMEKVGGRCSMSSVRARKGTAVWGLP